MTLQKPTVRGSITYIGENQPHLPVKRGLMRMNGRKATLVSLETGGDDGARARDIDTLKDVEVVEEATGLRVTGTSLRMIAEQGCTVETARVEIFIDPTGKCPSCS